MNPKHTGHLTRRTDFAIAGAFVLVFLAIYMMAGPIPNTIEGKTQITYWTGWFGDEQRALQGVIDQYNVSHPEVFVKTTSIANSYQKMKLAFAGNDTPDVCSTVWAEEIVDYALRGGLTPIDEYLADSSRGPEDYPQGVWKIYQYDGHTYALSIGMSTVFGVYNKKIFREVGLDPEYPPKSLEEFDRAAELCTKYQNGNPQDGLERLGFPYAGLLYWSTAFGVDFWDPANETVMIECPEMIACLNWLKSNVDKYGYQRSLAFTSTFGNVISPNNPFVSGKIAMTIVGEWYFHIIDDYAPEDFDWGWFPIPAPPGGRENCSFLSASMFVIPQASRHKEEAWEFMEWITSHQPIRQFRVGESPMGAPALRSVFDEPEYQTEYWQFVKELLESPNAMSPPKFPLFHTFLGELNRVEEYVLSGAKEPQEAIHEMRVNFQAAVDEVLLSAQS